MQYTCHQCEAKDRKLFVPERDPKTDIIKWMQGIVLEAVARDHADFNCSAERVDLKIHLPKDAEFIGQAPRS